MSRLACWERRPSCFLPGGSTWSRSSRMITPIPALLWDTFAVFDPWPRTCHWLGWYWGESRWELPGILLQLLELAEELLEVLRIRPHYYRPGSWIARHTWFHLHWGSWGLGLLLTSPCLQLHRCAIFGHPDSPLVLRDLLGGSSVCSWVCQGSRLGSLPVLELWSQYVINNLCHACLTRFPILLNVPTSLAIIGFALLDSWSDCLRLINWARDPVTLCLRSVLQFLFVSLNW